MYDQDMYKICMVIYQHKIIFQTEFDENEKDGDYDKEPENEAKEMDLPEDLKLDGGEEGENEEDDDKMDDMGK